MATWVTGYPISGQDVDTLYESETARIWEELNAPDMYDAQMKKAAKCMTASAELIDKAENELSAACVDLYDTPLYTVADDLLERLMAFRSEVEDLANRYGRGER